MTGTHPADTGARAVPRAIRDLAAGVVWRAMDEWNAAPAGTLNPTMAGHVTDSLIEDGLLVPAVVQPEATPDTDDEIERLERAAKDQIALAFEAEAEPWRLSTSSGDRLAWIAARAAVRAVLAARRSAAPDTDDDEDQYPTHTQVLASAAAHGDQWAIDELAEERAAIKRVVGEWWDAHGVVVHASSPHPLDDLVTRLTARRSAGEA